MALCLPRSRRAASLATRPSTLSVASITNHSCFTSAGLALTVVVIRLSSLVWRALFLGRCPSGGDLLGGELLLRSGAQSSLRTRHYSGLHRDPPAAHRLPANAL